MSKHASNISFELGISRGLFFPLKDATAYKWLDNDLFNSIHNCGRLYRAGGNRGTGEVG